MANTNKPFGFRPVGTLRGGPYTGKIQKFYVPSTDSGAIYIGDLVKTAGSSGALYAGDPEYPTATIAAAGNVVLGACVGIEPLYSDLSKRYRVASTGMYIYVDVDPDTIYEVQGDSTGFVSANIGLNANLSVVAGDTTTGVSKSVATTAAADATDDLLLLRFSPDPSNDVSSAPYVKVWVRLNLNQYADDSVGL